MPNEQNAQPESESNHSLDQKTDSSGIEWREVGANDNTDDEASEASPTPSATPIADQPSQINPDQLYQLFGPNLEQAVKRSEGTWYHPISKFTLTVVQDAQFRSAAADIYSNFDRGTLVGFEIAWVVIIWILRVWRLSKAQTWLARLWTTAWVSLLFSTGTILFIPWILWGNSALIALNSCIKALIHQFF
jgi:hypothetical protein